MDILYRTDLGTLHYYICGQNGNGGSTLLGKIEPRSFLITFTLHIVTVKVMIKKGRMS